MTEDQRSPGRGGLAPQTLRLVVLIGAALAAAFVIYLLWPEPTIDPANPSTWPVSKDRAVVLVRGLRRHCPRNTMRWIIEDKAWLETQASLPRADDANASDDNPRPRAKADILCVRAGRDLGVIEKVGRGAEDAPSSALYLALTPKQGVCPAGTNYETRQYCLTQTPLPPAPDIAP